MTTSSNILLIDDDEDFANLVSISLSRAGHLIECAHSGSAALELIATGRFKVVLVDLKMGDATGRSWSFAGLNLCRLIRQLPDGDHPRIVILTGNRNRQNLSIYFANGADDLVLKDDGFDVLAQRVAYWRRDNRGDRERQERRQALASEIEASQRAAYLPIGAHLHNSP
ncbi:MAG: response regulator [Pseudomonadota bacterium]